MLDPKPSARPLSPHLQIYKPMLTMMMSITHRITGVGLYLSAFLLVWWLSAAAASDSYFAAVQSCFGSWLGRLILFGFTWALLHHSLGGIKHLLWDTGRGFNLRVVEWLAGGSLAASISLTVILWIVGYGVMP